MNSDDKNLFPLVKRPDLITYKNSDYILFSDPIGDCYLNKSLDILFPNLSDTHFDEFWNLQGRGFCAYWIIEKDRLILNKYLGFEGLKQSLTRKGYFKHIHTTKKGLDLLKSDWDHMQSKVDECEVFECFSGELRLLETTLLNCSRLSWLFSDRVEIILTIIQGEVVNERRERSFLRFPHYVNLGSRCSEVKGSIFDLPHFTDGFMARQL